jgi:hypothetical protein
MGWQRQNGRMPAPTAATQGRKRTPGSPAKSRPRQRSGKKKAAGRSRPAARRLWPIAIAAFGAFVVAYLLDFTAIAQLIFGGLAEQLGQHIRIVSVGVLLLSGCVLAWTSLHPAPRPVAKAPRKPRPRAPRSTEKPVRAEADQASPSDDPPASGDRSSETDGRTAPAPQAGSGPQAGSALQAASASEAGSTPEAGPVRESAPRGRSAGRSRRGAGDASDR